ncbi:MAG: HDOD domain-containing protein [Syntrophobacterales bacterium]|nr:HDOD domain-containing protein [Syntrophobacterales bacterium]
MEIKELIERLETEGFPILKKTIQFVAYAENSKDPIPKLAEKILSDPGMSVKLVRTANSPFFNPSGVPIKTVTRAILMMGLQNVKAIALSLSLVEDVIDKKKRKKIALLLVQSIARAVLARNLGIATKCSSPEEIYIAGLIQDIGEIAIELMIDEEILEEIRRKAKLSKRSLEIVQIEELGFSAKYVSQALNNAWNISMVLKNLFSEISSPETLCLKTSDQLIRLPAVRKKLLGINSEDIENIYDKAIDDEIRKIEKMLKVDSHKIHEILKESAKELEYLISYCLPQLPLSHQEENEGEKQIEIPVDTISEKTTPEASYATSLDQPGIDFKLLNNFSHDMVATIHRGFKDPNILFSITMETIYNGLNMDLVLFLLVTPNRRSCFIRYSFLRPTVESILFPESIPLVNTKPHIFTYMMNKFDPLWIREPFDPEISDVIKHPILSTFLTVPCLLAPLYANKHLIGFVYADTRGNSSRITEDHFTGFSIASRLASIGLTLFVSKKQG